MPARHTTVVAGSAARKAVTRSSGPSVAPGGDRVDATGGEQVGREGGAGRVLGDRAQRGEEDRRAAAGASRISSKAGRSGAPAPRRPGQGSRSGSSSCRFGNSLTPGDRRGGGSRPAGPARPRPAPRTRTSRPSSASSEASTPPSASICCSWAQPACARSSVSRSTANAPPGGVGDPRDVGLVDQQRGGVAGVAAARARRAARGRLSKGSTVTAVGAADAGGERGDGAAQHVDPRVVPGQHRPAGDGVLHLAGRRPGAPDSSSTRCHRRRAARSLAIVRNCSSVAA